MGRPLGSYKQAPPLDHLDALEWAYLAGLVDGEGCISCAVSHRVGPSGNHRTHYNVRLTLGMTDKPSIQRIQGLLGGRVVSRRPQQTNWKATWIWRIGGQDHIRVVLTNLHPYLITKRDQANIVLAHRANRDTYLTLKRLNRRGTRIMAVSKDQEDRQRRALGRKLTIKAAELRQTSSLLRNSQEVDFLNTKESKTLGKLLDQLDVVAKHFDGMSGKLP